MTDNKSELFNQACDRIFDMLLADDGEAFFEGEKFLKQHRPDLYNLIGEMSSDKEGRES